MPQKLSVPLIISQRGLHDINFQLVVLISITWLSTRFLPSGYCCLPFHILFFGGKSQSPAHIQRWWGINLHLLEQVLFLLTYSFIHSFNHLFTSVKFSMSYIYLFYTLGYNPILLIFASNYSSLGC